MKQNSRILFHHMRKPLRKSYLGQLTFAYIAVVLISTGCMTTMRAEKLEFPASFDPAKGFKPAQSDLTEVFLQIAGSLEFYGSPEPYLRHMKAEHARIEARYQRQLGEKHRSFCPAYVDDAYFDRFAANWKHIAPQLGLESLAKSTGHLMTLAINGSDGKGTVLVETFNQHQHEVYVAMTSNAKAQIPNFDVLKASLVKNLRLDDMPVPASNLSADQKAAVNPVSEIRAAFVKLFAALDAGLPVADAEKVKTAIGSIFTDVGRMAQSELEIAILEESLDDLRSPKPPYAADQEKTLNAEEQKTFAAFLKRRRFTKADFSALDKFYRGTYDKLSERGKEEMHFRIQAGMRPAD